MRNTILISIFLGLLIFYPVFSQNNDNILEISDRYSEWQSIIGKKLKDSEKFFNYAWGENYQYDKWYSKSLDNDTLTLSEIISTIQDDALGTYIYNDVYSFSGDWYIAIDYYYDINDKLYFIFWRMNSFYAEEPVTVEKRLYFDKNGDKIQELQSVYKMNTNEKTDINFMDMDVDYKLDLKEMDFYRFWKND